MRAAPCGCDLIERAQKEADPRGRRVLESDGERLRSSWQCVLAKPGTHAHTLTPAHLGVVDAASRLARGKLPDACPSLCTRYPAAGKVVTWLQWRKEGALALLMRNPSKVQVDALTALSEAVNARDVDENERILREAKAKVPTK